MLMPVLVLALVLRERGEEEQAARSETQVPCSQPPAQVPRVILSTRQKKLWPWQG